MCYFKVNGYNRNTKIATSGKTFSSFSDALEEALSQVFHRKHTMKTASAYEMQIYQVSADGSKALVATCPCTEKATKARKVATC